MALKIDEIVEVLRSNQVPVNNIRKIVEELQSVEDEKRNEVKDPKSKKQFILVTNSADTGFALQIEAEEDAGQTLEKVKTAARAFNNSRGGQKNPVRNLVQSLQELPSKFLVEAGVWRKTKEPVRTLNITDGGAL